MWSVKNFKHLRLSLTAKLVFCIWTSSKINYFSMQACTKKQGRTVKKKFGGNVAFKKNHKLQKNRHHELKTLVSNCNNFLNFATNFLPSRILYICLTLCHKQAQSQEHDTSRVKFLLFMHFHRYVCETIDWVTVWNFRVSLISQNFVEIISYTLWYIIFYH